MGLTACPQSRPGHANCMEWHKETRSEPGVQIPQHRARFIFSLHCCGLHPGFHVLKLSQMGRQKYRQAHRHRRSGKGKQTHTGNQAMYGSRLLFKSRAVLCQMVNVRN